MGYKWYHSILTNTLYIYISFLDYITFKIIPYLPSFYYYGLHFNKILRPYKTLNKIIFVFRFRFILGYLKLPAIDIYASLIKLTIRGLNPKLNGV